jgi:hypothetical protein
VQDTSWTGNFTDGDRVLDNLTPTSGDNATYIQFSQPVLGAGTQLQFVTQNPVGAAFTGRARAYATPFIDGEGGNSDDNFNPLTDVSFDLAGFSCNSSFGGCDEGSAIFMGFSNGSIIRMGFEVLEGRFGINQLDIGVRQVVVTPGPGTFVLMVTGVLALVYGSRRFARR